MNRTRLFSARTAAAVTAALALVAAAALVSSDAAAQDKPKAVVITGWAANAADKAWHDKIAAEAKKDLEAAGYDVEVVTQPTKATAVDKIKDPKTEALVIIDHGRPGEQRIPMVAADGSKDPLLGSDLTGPFNQIKIATIHACDQDQKSWKDKFPNSDFKSWTGCIYPDTELEWQIKKKYAPVQTPQSDQETLDMHGLLEDGQFPLDADGIPVPTLPLSGNWAMNPALAFAFGNQNYNFFVYDQDLLGVNPEILFSAQAANGVVLSSSPAQAMSAPDFNIYFTHELFVDATENPFVLLDPGVLGTRASVELLGSGADPTILFAGVAKNLFNIDPTQPNGGHPLPLPATWLLLFAGLALALAWRRPQAIFTYS